MRTVLKRKGHFRADCRVAAVGAVLALIAANDAGAQSAGDILEKTSPQHRIGYVNGVIEGLAFARYLRDRPDTTGMKCIYNWHLKGEGSNWNRIVAWLERHPEQRVGALIYVLVKQECGE